MNLPHLPNRDVMQACWLVDDLDAAIDNWARHLGVGPFFWFDVVTFDGGYHRGVRTDFPRVTAAIAYAGDIQIELVRQDNNDPGVFRDLYASGDTGLHHLARVCIDYEAERNAFIASGAALAFEGSVGGSRTCWVDTSPTLGFMMELLEASESRTNWFGHMRRAARTWDGTTAVIGGPRERVRE